MGYKKQKKNVKYNKQRKKRSINKNVEHIQNTNNNNKIDVDRAKGKKERCDSQSKGLRGLY